MKNSNPTTELLRIEADDQKTHALLCAVMRARRKAEETGYMDHHLEAIKEWEETLHDTYFADRK